MSTRIRERSSQVALLAIGVSVGLFFARPGERIVLAGGTDRHGESAVTTGMLSAHYNPQSKIQASVDAVYYLDYRGSRLLAFLPSMRQSGTSAHFIESVAERDLAADFGISPNAPPPRFMMTTASFGAYTGEGWAGLFVFETVSKRVGVYKVSPQLIGVRPAPKFELIEMRSFATANSEVLAN